jgi:hypothetical protein
VRYYWNDKEVSVEEYEALDLEWKKQVELAELQEKIQESESSSRKKSGKQKIG